MGPVSPIWTSFPTFFFEVYLVETGVGVGA